MANLEKQHGFQQGIVKATVRSDITLVSEFTKNIILPKLTVPWDNHLEQAYKKEKWAKCDDLVVDC